MVVTMSVWMVGQLEPEAFWRQVCAMADDLLEVSPLRDWTVIIASTAGDEADEWDVDVDPLAKEMRVGPPAGPEAADDSEPDELATYIVLDLLHETVLDSGE